MVTWPDRLCETLKGSDPHAQDQLLRAYQSIPLNLAEGNRQLPSADRKRLLRIALESALECAATLDVLAGCGAIGEETAPTGKAIGSGLFRCGQKWYWNLNQYHTPEHRFQISTPTPIPEGASFTRWVRSDIRSSSIVADLFGRSGQLNCRI